MTILKILQYPDKRLKRIAVPVQHFNSDIKKIIDDMFETHYVTMNCAALAATQLDTPVPWRITVIDFSTNKNEPLCLVNPQIIACEGEQFEYEGCMSIYPNFIHEKVKRAMLITVQAQDKNGNPFQMSAQGYMAKCIQHEIDHLDGKLFIDHLHQVSMERCAKKIKKHLRIVNKEISQQKK